MLSEPIIVATATGTVVVPCTPHYGRGGAADYGDRVTDQMIGDTGAPLIRPAPHTVLLELEREVDASPSEVFDLLVPRLAPADGHTKFAVYPDSFTAVMQGDWWYRGEYRVIAVPGGARVSYTVVNKAREQHEAGNLISKGTVAAAPDAFARHLDAVEESLEHG